MPRVDPLPHFRKRKALGTGLSGLIQDCCAAALESDTPTDAAVHQARRALKRARALLRLGETLAVANAKTMRRRLAMHARKLSKARDNTVVTKVARHFVSRKSGKKARVASAFLHLHRSRKTAGWAGWQKQLAAEKPRLARVAWGEPTAADLARALRKSFRRACKWSEKSAREKKIATAHEWRKSVIILREQLMSIGLVVDKNAGARARDFHRVAHHLGKALDADLFAEAIQKSASLPKGHQRVVASSRKKREASVKKARECWRKAAHGWSL